MSQTLDHEQEHRRLSAMMRDPRYWRHKDPALVAKVTEGFQRLFNPSEAEQRAELGQAANVAGATGPAHARDVIIGHLAPGEIVVPPRAQTRAVLDALQNELGDEIGRFTVGSGLERRNPVSGLPAFAPENEEEDSSFDILDFFSGLFRSKIGFPDRPQVPRDRRLEPFSLFEKLKDQPDRQLQHDLERQLGRPGVSGGGGGGFPQNPKLRRPGILEEEPRS